MFLCITSIAPGLLAQQDATAPAPSEQPEEVIVVGNRALMALRLKMLDDEKAAYDVFNRFNDEKRFEISCSKQQLTGSRFAKQICQPEFEIQAYRTHGRHYLENMRDYYMQLALGVAVPNENTPPVHVPVEAMIASQQKAYRRKMQQVAEEHPEFLEALIRYSESRAQYETAVGTAREQ